MTGSSLPFALHTRAIPSADPVTMYNPSGLNSALITPSSSLPNIIDLSNVSPCQICAAPAEEAVAEAPAEEAVAEAPAEETPAEEAAAEAPAEEAATEAPAEEAATEATAGEAPVEEVPAEEATDSKKAAS